jgi:hypothetical protein
VAQASFRRKLSSPNKRLPSSRYSSWVLKSVRRFPLAKSGVGLVGVIATALLFLHWQLLLATVAGIGVMACLYFGQQWNWEKQLRSWQYFLKGFNRQLLIAVGGGSFAAMGTYLGTVVWTDSDSPGIAIATILQGCGTVLTLTLVLWQLLRRPQGEEMKFEAKTQALTHPQPLKRLMAIRQLTQWATHKGFNPTYRQQVVEYFRLMLTQEKETMIQDALWESLQTLDKIQLTPQPRPSQPIQLPHLQSHRTKIRQPLP